MGKLGKFLPVKPDVHLPSLEKVILDFWEKEKIFQKSIQQSLSTPPYSFYDGPPFATGLPHYGHLLASTLKDIIPRYWTMQGYCVPRRFGWDCHGLPVEYEINKIHQIESREDILKMGIPHYNAACRSIVKRYSEEWKKTIQRLGRWVDMDQPYYTMDIEFMESVWWVFQKLYEKGLIYEGYKVVPYSTGISTPLSNFEANLNYKTVQDPSITVAFPFVGLENTFFLAWTTTPWTLPSNMALAVGKKFTYVKVLELSSKRNFILAEVLLSHFFKNSHSNEYTVLERLPGDKLLDNKYVPLFPYFKDQVGAFRVVHSDHVTLDSGTGIVHIAPAFGEQDYAVCMKEKIPVVNPVNDDGFFTCEIKEYAGKRVKEADSAIIADLKQKGLLFKQETIDHSYPFCYRSDTPLIYRAVSSWFLAVEKLKDRLIENNKKTQWVPEHLRDGRFGHWLENARDWAISRHRFWGTPLPIWRNPEGEIICVGSRAELEKLAQKEIADLHIEHIDSLSIPSPTGRSPLRRIEGVLDCWFESGSMPYAQWGYPKKNKEAFERGFPADFIAEGLDQTRGWFYTLMVIGTALFDQAPFRHVVVNGLVLAEDGRKMSKRLKNYPDPLQVLDDHGADALRLYLIDSPVVKAQELKFSEGGVRDIVRKILLRWWNAYSFFINYANIDQFELREKNLRSQQDNLLDQWILSRMHSLIEHTKKEMSAYRLYLVVPRLLQFIEELTNTYIRFNRSHFWKEGMPEDKQQAYETLYTVLINLSRIMAPFAPFLAETTYQNLMRASQESCSISVHLESFPQPNLSLLKPDLEKAVLMMETLVTLGRNQREKMGIKGKIPLLQMRVIHRDLSLLQSLKRFEHYFKNELNIREIIYDHHESQFIRITAKANFPVLGKRLGSKMKSIASAIQKLGTEALLELENGSFLLLEGESISLSDIEIQRQSLSQNQNLVTHPLVSIEIDPTVKDEQIVEGLAREVARKIQAARKNADLNLDDRIELELKCSGLLRQAIEAHQKMICTETLALKMTFSETPQGTQVEEVNIDDQYPLQIAIHV